MSLGTTRRSILTTAIAGSGAAALAACGVGSGAEAPKGARPAVTLEFWSRMGQGAGRAYIETGEFEEKRLPVFSEQNAPVKVNRTVISNGDELLQKLTVAYVGGVGPDVFNIGSPGVAQLSAPGFTLDLGAFPRAKKEASDFFQSGI